MTRSFEAAPRWHLVLARGGPFAFFVSLGFGAWLVLARLAAPPDSVSAPWRALWVNVLLYTVFALHHSVLARSGAKRWVRAALPGHLERALYVWVASLLFIALCVLWRPLPGRVFLLTGPAAWAVVGLQACGALVALAGGRGTDLEEFMGVRDAARACGHEPAPAPRAELMASGAYRYVRHPLYLGVILLLGATPSMTVGRLVFAGLSALYILIAIPFEERTLVEQYGDAYRQYQRRVPWRLVPGMW
jgi:protein-S-isoprenylcysteine O-methyltransferase Ste14